MSDKAEDKSLGISIRLIKEWDISKDHLPRYVEFAMPYSCVLLGHTWHYNVGEAFCQVCGAPNLALATANVIEGEEFDTGTDPGDETQPGDGGPHDSDR